jgi:hypothetical protein
MPEGGASQEQILFSRDSINLPVFRSGLGCPDSGTVDTVLMSGAL